ncbi:SPASM domain-containing protein [Desulfovibrio sp. OttesenSCG-928-F20]|nr:SPASM domain-containing protein [Desulfovibrio sp. OttesenSCG-928-M16]MDL2291235.1 SPASM domain-containing protein [Desulfovibrio sp. OttesenSCG-928-F20]
MIDSKKISVLWFGTGSMTQNLLPAVNSAYLHIAAFVDECGEFPRSFEGRPVIRPDEIGSFDPSYIFVACRPAELVVSRLVHDYCLPVEEIISLDFENICQRNIHNTTHVQFEQVLEAYLFSYPGLHEAFFLSNLLQSPWLHDVKKEFKRHVLYDDAFFCDNRYGSMEETAPDFFHALALPLTLPAKLRSMQIETTAHCGYRCFCCASHKAERRKGVMSKEDLMLLTRRVGKYAGKVLLHHGGEPLLDKELPEKIGLLHDVWPEAVLTFVSTLGVPVSAVYLDSLWENGLNDIEISHYGHDRTTYQNIHGADTFELARKNLHYLLESPVRRKHGGTLRVRMLHMEENAMVNQEMYTKQAAAFRAMVLSHPDVRTTDTYLSSHSGQGSITRQRATVLPCSVMWGEFGARINVTWDLNVVTCCQDFDNHLVFGNLRHESLEEIFSGPVYTDFAQAAWKGDFSRYPLCRNCERHGGGNVRELLRIFAWKIADILLNAPQGPHLPFSIIGETRFASPLASFFQRNAAHYHDLPIFTECVCQGMPGYLFIAASGKTQLAYYDSLMKSGLFNDLSGVKIVPLAGISYYMETEAAVRMTKIYTDLGLL